MGEKKVFLLLVSLLLIQNLTAQIERVFVETYYISDVNDSRDSTCNGTQLEEGSKTYRVFVDLNDNSAITALSGSPQHPFLVSSTENFYNYEGTYFSGCLFGYEIKRGRIKIGNVPLDSWLTIGYVTDLHVGIPKESDSDGSILGGTNNNGMLLNDDSAIGIPLIVADGLIPETNYNINQFSFEYFLVDSTFGKQTYSKEFLYNDSLSNNFLKFNNGIQGPTPENIVLIGQFTTKGELNFNINLKVRVGYNQTGDEIIYHYVGTDSLTDAENRIFYSNWLNYPYTFGCTDPNYAQYNPDASIDDGSCSDLIILGCADPSACNYDPEVNWPVSELCCYGPNDCDDRDIALICPDYYSQSDLSLSFDFEIFPNPVSDDAILDISWKGSNRFIFKIYNSSGNIVLDQNFEMVGNNNERKQFNLSGLDNGLYFIRLISENGQSVTKSIIKNERF